MVPSDRFRYAFKVALAMVITYAIALSMDWEKPFWAGLSVAFCSLATAGESINRGVHRVLGTLLAGFVALTLMALFPQDRWPFLLAMSGFIALCTYQSSGGSRFAFIWFNAGFNLPILVMLGEGVSLNTFDMVILRGQETALGVVVYSLVAVLLWPRRGGAAFENAVRAVCSGQHQLFGRYLGSMTGTPDDGGAEPLRAQLGGQLARLGGQLEGAAYDSDEIRQSRRAWRRCLTELSVLSKAMDRWRLGFEGLRDLDLQRLMPGLRSSGTALETRFAAIEGMLGGQPPPQQPQAVGLRLDRDELRRISHFQRAAVVLCRDQLLRIDERTQVLFENIREIRGHGSGEGRAPSGTPTVSTAVIDPDRLAATVRQSATLWLALLMVIFVPAFPNPVGVIALANAFAMVLSMAPHVQASVLLLPTILGAVFAGSLYVFVLPHLSGFGELGTIIFAATFLIGYLFHRPQAVLAKSMGLCMLVIMIGVENEQSYNFLYFANWFIAGILFVVTLMVAWRFPISFRPEERFMRMLDRFFRSAGFVLSRPLEDTGGTTSWLSRWRRAFHLQQMTALPQRLRAWAGMLPPAALGDTSRDQLQSLLSGIQALSDHVQGVLDAKPAVRSEVLARELGAEGRDWQASVEEAFSRFAIDPGAVDHAVFRARLVQMLARLETRIEETLNKGDAATLSIREGENLYRLLGAYRGLSEALVDLAGRVSPVDWARLREARF